MATSSLPQTQDIRFLSITRQSVLTEDQHFRVATYLSHSDIESVERSCRSGQALFSLIV